MQKRRTTNKKLSTIAMLFFLMNMMSCSQYKSTWSCKISEGLGCTSIAYADELARKEIILNDSLHSGRSEEEHENKVLITKHYADLELNPEKEITLDK